MNFRKQFWKREVAYAQMSPMVKFGDEKGTVEVNGRDYKCTYLNNDGSLVSRGCVTSEEAIVWLARQEKINADTAKGAMSYGMPQRQFA